MIAYENYNPQDFDKTPNKVKAANGSNSAVMPGSDAIPRIYTRCPACFKDTLTINDGHLLCTWHVCPDPTMIDKLGERQATEDLAHT